jgi:hypothetical protein
MKNFDLFSARIRENLPNRALYPMFEYIFPFLCRVENQIAGTGLFPGRFSPRFFAQTHPDVAFAFLRMISP